MHQMKKTIPDHHRNLLTFYEAIEKLAEIP